MLNNVISEIIRKQRPYFFLESNPIKGQDDRYWLIFKHRDADNLLHNIVTFLGLGDKQVTHKLFRIDLKTAQIYEYSPRSQSNLPTNTLLRTSSLKAIETFLYLENTTIEPALLAGSFLELEKKKRKFSLPDELTQYQELFIKCLERAVIYRRSTAYFDSGILKLYEEPLQHIVKSEGQIRLLMDWQGFTKQADLDQLAKLSDPKYLASFAQNTLIEFLSKLSNSAFSGTEIMAELIRLGLLQIKLIKMTQGRGIYHKKTGILSDSLNNHILHEGSDNFTRAAYVQNAESVTFFYSTDQLDEETIRDSIQQFDQEWQREDISFDLTQEFLEQVLRERERRIQRENPSIDFISPDQLNAGDTTPVEIHGQNLAQVVAIEISNDPLVQIEIENQEPARITGNITIDYDRPPRPLNNFKLKTPSGIYQITPKKTPTLKNETLTIGDYSEIVGFKEAIASIIAGVHGKPLDFLYWLAMQRPQLLRVKPSDLLDQLVDQELLFEHQKSGAQHCLRVMQDFGVVICADAVGLGKTRLAAAVAKLYLQETPQAKIAIIAAKKLHTNWEQEMATIGFKGSGHDYELYNKNLMSRKGSNFQTDFQRYGGPDLVIIDEAHEGIRNYNNRIHQTCLTIRKSDRQNQKQRHFLLLTATPWNNRREDIYNLLFPFLSRPEGFRELQFPREIVHWFDSRDIGVENFTDNTKLFRRTYRELFLQRTRKMLKEATPSLNLYATRIAQWLPVVFEPSTEQALEQIFTQFESNLFIPSVDPIRYLSGNVDQRSLLANQRRFFLQRAESSMYALNRTIKNFSDRISLVKNRLQKLTPDADGLKTFLFQHYGLSSDLQVGELDELDLTDDLDEDSIEEDDDEIETNEKKQEKRQQLNRSIEFSTDTLRNDPERAKQIYQRLISDCDSDLAQLEQIQKLLADEFIKDHKREQVTQQVKQLVKEGKKVLLISTFSDTVINYYYYMANQSEIVSKGIGMIISSSKSYYGNSATKPSKISPYNLIKGKIDYKGLKRSDIFRLFAPVATCKNPADRPNPTEEIAVLIGSETLSVGQNLQDADYLINIDLPWNPMVLEQRIGRIDRPKEHKTDHIYIYYANSDNQLLRQASRLLNLNKKLVGDIITRHNNIPSIATVEALGASVYGDTQFDDEILPDYIDFIQSLVKARKLEQGNLQEATYIRQETNRDIYTHHEILHWEELKKLVERLGLNYQVNPIAIGSQHHQESPTGLVALKLEYFGPNGEAILLPPEIIYWNDQTEEKDGYGIAIATAFKTPDISEVISANKILTQADNLYQKLVLLKQKYQAELDHSGKSENISLSSERISKIQKRVINMNSFPSAIDRKTVKETLKKLSQHTEQKQVQKLLKEFTEGIYSQLNNHDFMKQLVKDTELLNLLCFEIIKPTTVKVSLSALLLRT